MTNFYTLIPLQQLTPIIEDTNNEMFIIEDGDDIEI